MLPRWKPALALGVSAAVAYRLLRVTPLRWQPAAQPAQDYREALDRLRSMQVGDGPPVNPVCRTQMLTHGQRVEKAVVLLHGFTNCPHQYVDLAAQLHARGCNVLVPRLPHHGLEPLAPDLAQITVEEMVAMAHAALDIAHGLGEEVTLLGFSAGGALAAWIAQHRGDVSHVIIASPALSVLAVAPHLRRVYANGLSLLPNFFRWWDEELKERISGPSHAYPRVASRALGALLRLGLLVEQSARQAPPAAPRITVVTNPVDDVSDNAVTDRLVDAWRRRGAAVRTYAFPAALGLLHDYIDPAQVGQQTAAVYPTLLELIA